MTLKFKKLTEYGKGSIYSLLYRSYKELSKEIPNLLWKWQEDWRQYEEKIFKYPKTVGTSGFLTIYNDNIVGFGSFDPRQQPELGIIGHNCVLPEFRNKGFGKQQILKIISRFKELGIKKASVTTGEHPFFIPAQKMYISCGFKEVHRYLGKILEFREIDYILEIC